VPYSSFSASFFSPNSKTTIGRIVSFQDLTIRNNEQGKPYFIPSEKLRLYLVDRNIKQAHLSLSDEKFNAVAFVVLELGEKNEDEKGEYGTTF
jgi:holo-[acyl-carrier protein] synthase